MQPRKRIITLIVASALFMQNLDSTVLGTALAEISDSLGVDAVHLHMTMTGYLLSLAVFMPVSGWLADRFGARTVFCLAVAIFTLASVACAFASSLAWLVSARVVQGVGGAMMMPVARLALLRAVPKSEFVNAMAWVAVPALIGPVIGPPVGGFIVAYWSWPWIFWINVPIGILGIALALRTMDNDRDEDVPPFDIVGFLLVGVAFSGLIFGLEAVGGAILPRWASLLALLAGAAAFAAYVAHARRTQAPVLDLSLLDVPTFFAGVVGGGLFRIGIGAMPFLLPVMLQVGFGYTPIESGMTTLAAALGALTMKFGAEAFIRRYGFRHMLIWTTLLSAVSLAACMFFTPRTPAALIFAVLLVGGFVRSMAFTALNALSFADLDQRQMSQASAFAAVGQQLSLSAGVGIAATMLNAVTPHGTPPEAADFIIPFAVVAALVAASAAQFVGLSPEAGNEMANRAPKPQAGARIDPPG